MFFYVSQNSFNLISKLIYRNMQYNFNSIGNGENVYTFYLYTYIQLSISNRFSTYKYFIKNLRSVLVFTSLFILLFCNIAGDNLSRTFFFYSEKKSPSYIQHVSKSHLSLSQSARLLTTICTQSIDNSFKSSILLRNNS